MDIISTVGDEEVKQRFLEVGSDIRERIRQALGRIGENVADAARGIAPSRTGALRASIAPFYQETLLEQREIIKAGEFYALFLEHGVVQHGGASNRNAGKGKKQKLSRLHLLRSQGLWRIQPHPFMSKALQGLRAQIDADLEAAVDEGIAVGEK